VRRAQCSDNVIVFGGNGAEDETEYAVAGGARLVIADGSSLIANGSTSDILVRSGNGTWSYVCSLSRTSRLLHSVFLSFVIDRPQPPIHTSSSVRRPGSTLLMAAAWWRATT
jgi:hypothetical protein